MIDAPDYKLLMDRDVTKILSATYREALSAHGLCLKYNIPVARCYSIVKRMENAGLLTVEKMVPLSNKQVRKYYRSRITSVVYTVESGEIKVSYERPTEIENNGMLTDLMKDIVP
ncbi:MAG: hypothetical protein U9R75_06810 [Candidatus Thermoplasmatota archaeon]|nr:hypothetical protein [Candidatus Thermoplasmatota archaeon]